MNSASLAPETVGAQTKGSPANDQLLALIYQNTFDCLYLLQVEPGDRFTFVSVNDAFLKSAGFSRADVVGRPIEDVAPAANQDQARSRYKQVVETRAPVSYDVSVELPVGRRYGEVTLAPVLSSEGTVTHILGAARDVSDRREAEAERTRDAMLLANVRDSVIVTDADGIVTYWNDGATRLFGWTAEEMIGRRYTDHIWDSDAQAYVAEKMRTHLETGWSMECPSYRNDGSRIWIDARIVPLKNAEGTFLGLLGISHDISARKEAEEEIARVTEQAQRDRRFYETILSSTPDLVYVFSLDYRFQYANEALLKLWGRTRDEAIGKSLLELGYEPWHAEMHEREIDKVQETRQPIRGEVPFTGTAGRRIYDYIFVPVFGADGEVEAVAGTTRDVTDRKRAEEELRASESEFRTTFENAGVGKAQATPDGRLVLVNPKLCELLEYSAKELVGMTIGEITHPDEREQNLELFRRMVRGETSHYAVEKRYITKSGATKWVRVTATMLRGPEGEPRRASAVIEDITSRKEAEAALADASRRKDEFLATLAHELRNPLAPIRTGLQILRHTNDAAATQKVLEMMERQLSHSVRLIDDLMDVSRITTGKFELRRERVLLQDVLSAALEASRPTIEAGGHEFDQTIPGEPLWLDADQTRMAQVVTNLLTNAAKYTPEKGRITLDALRDGDEAVVSVTDTGLGIPPNMLSEVFTMFTQVNRTLDRSQGGLGIGLALVKRLVEMHGGSITAASEGTGLGSTFTVRVPLDPAKTTPDAESGFETHSNRQCAFRVLVVDDNRDAADSLSTLLEMAGHAAVTAYNGTTAMELADKLKPDLVFLDLGMPGMNGFEVARRLRTVPELGKTTLVALTGWGSPEDKRKTTEAGFDAHLTKPADAEEVERLIANLAERRFFNPNER